MFISNLPVALQSRTMFEDVMFRSGGPDSESVCPYNGRLEYLSYMLRDFSGSAVKLFSDIKDYNLDVTRPDDGAHKTLASRDISSAYDPVDNTDPGYIRRLEDLDESWVYKYFDNMIYGKTAIHNKGGVREYKYNNREQFSMRDKDDDTIRTLSDLASEKFNSSKEVSARERLPYLLKKLYEKGLESGIHTISLIIAYEKASIDVFLSNTRKSYQSKLSIVNLLNYPVYEQASNGDIIRMFTYDTGRTNKKVQAAFDWIRGYSEDTRVYPYIPEFIDCLKVLGVDIKTEDPLIYNNELLDSICCTYITSNKEYIFGGKGINYAVINELNNITLDNWMQKRVNSDVVDEATLVASTIQKWNDLIDTPIPVSDVLFHEFFHYYGILSNVFYKLNELVTENNIFSQKRGTPIYFDISRYNKKGFRVGLLTCTGLLLAVSTEEIVYAINTSTAVSYIKQLLKVEPYDTSFGKWEVL